MTLRGSVSLSLGNVKDTIMPASFSRKHSIILSCMSLELYNFKADIFSLCRRQGAESKLKSMFVQFALEPLWKV